MSQANFECTNCKGRVIADLPRAEVYNSAAYSAMVAVHEKNVNCPSCGQVFIPFIRGVAPEWGFAESKAQPEPSRLLLVNRLPPNMTQ
jgi:hypothetical protein